MRKHLLTIGVFTVLIGLFAFAANDWKAPWTKKPAPNPADWCKEHKIELSKCAKCKPELARGGTFAVREREPREGECANTLVRLTLAPGAAERMNLQFHTVDAQSASVTIRANAEATYPPTQYSRVAPRIGGIIRKVKAVLGQEVESGETLAVLESSDFGQLKADYLQALSVLNLRQKTHEQEQTLYEKKITAGRELLQATTDLEEAKLNVRGRAQRLAGVGLSQDDINALEKKQDTSAFVPVVAPFKGLVVEASAVPGEMARLETPVFSVANVERMWVTIDIDESDLPKIEKGQKVNFSVDGFPGQKFPGKVAAIGAEVDGRTRTVRVFGEVKNTRGLLRAHMFGRADIVVKPAEPKLLVPKEAVQDDGDCRFVFVSPLENVFQTRKVDLGTNYGNAFEVVGGLVKGDKVVTSGSFLLKTEVMRGQMGAG